MPKQPVRPKPQSTPQPPPRQHGGSLAAAMGALPLPPKIGRPPALRVSKPGLASPARPAVARPRPSQAGKPVSNIVGRQSMAGRLGSLAAPPLASVNPPRGLGSTHR